MKTSQNKNSFKSNLFCHLGLHQLDGVKQQKVGDKVVTITDSCAACSFTKLTQAWRIQYEDLSAEQVKPTRPVTHLPTMRLAHS